MKRLLAALTITMLACGSLKAASNWDDAGVRAAGTYAETVRTDITTYTATALWAQSVWDVNLDIFNSSAYTIYIGTNTTTLVATGMPILSSKTFTLDGQFTDVLYATADPAAAGNTIVRIIRYKRRGN